LENARVQEDFAPLYVSISKQVGPCAYRVAPPSEL
jgi:hypothetical protein